MPVSTAFKYLLVIFLPLHLLFPCMLQEELDAVERLVQNIVLLIPLFCGEVKGEVAIIDSIKKETHLLDVTAIVAVKPDVDCY